MLWALTLKSINLFAVHSTSQLRSHRCQRQEMMKINSPTTRDLALTFCAILILCMMWWRNLFMHLVSNLITTSCYRERLSCFQATLATIRLFVFLAWSWKNHWCICWLKLQWQTAMWQKWQSNSTTGYLEFWRRMNFSCIFFRTDWAVSSQNKSKSHFKCGSAKLSFTRVTHWSPIQRFMSGISSSPVRQQFRKTLPTRKQRSSFLSAWMCKRNRGKHGKLLPKRRCKRGTRPKLPRQKNGCMRRCQILQINLVIRFLQTLKWK